jgi:hypothetical protein
MSLVNASQSIWRLRLIDVLYDQSERYRRLQASYISGMLNSAEEHRAAAAIACDKQNATRLLGLHLKKTAEMVVTITYGLESRNHPSFMADERLPVA